jgi:hypothetical protein
MGEMKNREPYDWNIEPYKWTPEMGEISGFGRGYEEYEEGCRFMVSKGLEFLDEARKQYPTDGDPKYITFHNVYGIAKDANKIAEELDKFLLWKIQDYFGPRHSPTGAMHQAVVGHILWILAHSWKEYVQEMSKNKQERWKEDEK